MSDRDLIREARKICERLAAADPAAPDDGLMTDAYNTVGDLIQALETAEIGDYADESDNPDFDVDIEERVEDAIRERIRSGNDPQEIRISGRRILCDGQTVAMLWTGGSVIIARRFEDFIGHVGLMLEGR